MENTLSLALEYKSMVLEEAHRYAAHVTIMLNCKGTSLIDIVMDLYGEMIQEISKPVADLMYKHKIALLKKAVDISVQEEENVNKPKDVEKLWLNTYKKIVRGVTSERLKELNKMSSSERLKELRKK